MKKFLYLFLLVSTSAFAAKIIMKETSRAYISPSKSARAVYQLPKSKTYEITGKESNGFYELKTNNGQSLWVPKESVELQGLEELPGTEESNSTYQGNRFSYNFGAGVGTYDGESSYELHFNLYYHLLSYLAWKNSVFYHTQSDYSFVGLDTSALAYYVLGGNNSFHITPSVGLGYRFASKNASAPFVEGGLSIDAGFIRVGVHGKYLLYSMADDGRSDQSVIGLSLGGSGSF